MVTPVLFWSIKKDYDRGDIWTSIRNNHICINKIIFINGRIEKIDFNYEDQNKIQINDEIEKKITFDKKNSLIDLNMLDTTV